MRTNKDKQSKSNDFRKIIIPIDGSKDSKRAAKKALHIAKETDAEVIALYVIEEPNMIYPEFSTMFPDALELLKKEGHSILDNIKKMGSEMGVNVKTKLVVGFPDQEIIKEAGKNDLIVMGCKGKSALDRIIMGSVCQKVLHHSSSPVMIIR